MTMTKCKKQQKNVKQVTNDIDNFQPSVKLMGRITNTIYKMMKFCDQYGPLMGDVYEGMDNILREITDNLEGQNVFEKVYEYIHNIVIASGS